MQNLQAAIIKLKRADNTSAGRFAKQVAAKDIRVHIAQLGRFQNKKQNSRVSIQIQKSIDALELLLDEME